MSRVFFLSDICKNNVFAFKDIDKQNMLVYHLYKLRELAIFKLLGLDELGALIREGVRNPDCTFESDGDGFNVPIEVLGLE